ncbi:nickel transporter [Hafnia paralvei]|uniref:nickel/cobalt transporter n=1 Tax=Hafnia paralvei TaxID=546367 RepID=UPI000DF25839|nr:nickel/cobalt transporter [Hafnia paralvei]RDA61289.1 nickel transporter [Hafnia paralvei]RDA69922.1 nickel transporter [Hafnia paralvei]RDA73607.1 nickel transporter [Hafnia paralvei]RDA74015.1 nickel transporter [Hafnia paralvei]RDA74451.1 nickel transporter [Hafnia paralvei]
MSLIFSSTKKSSTCGRYIPIAMMTALAMSALVYAFVHWNDWLLVSIEWQKSLHQSMSYLLQRVADNERQAGLTLVALSFAYGVLHALGPGHGKVVITTYLATHPSRLRSSVRLTLAASLLQGLVAIALVSGVLGVLQLSTRDLHLSSFWLEKASYALVIFLGAVLCWRALNKIRMIRRSSLKSGLQISVIKPLEHHHQHSANCGCGHKHVANDREIATATTWRTQLAVVAAMGMRPCSGAILVLLFSKVIGVYLWGVLAAMAMAAGTALTISGIAFLVHIARKIVERWAIQRGRNFSPYWRLALMLSGGVLLILIGLLMYQSAALTGMGSGRVFGR